MARDVLKGRRILVAEDAPDNQLLIQRFLASRGAEVHVVDDGAEAVRVAQLGHYDIVLMDVQMPLLDGHGATTELRMRGFRSPIIALTAHAMREERERCIRSGYDEHVAKPINFAHLIEVITGFLEGPGPRDFLAASPRGVGAASRAPLMM